jgi:hypothetical protein
LELEKAAEHGAQRGVKIKKPWDSADGHDATGGQFGTKLAAVQLDGSDRRRQRGAWRASRS